MAPRKKTEAPKRARSRSSGEPSLREAIEASGETPVDEARAAEQEQRDDLLFLAREFLTWLVFHVEEGGGEFAGDDEVPAFTISFGGRLTLRTPAGLVTDMVVKGPSPVGSPDLRYALAGGLAVKEADLRLEQNDRGYGFALAAEHFDLKRVKLPALLDEDTDDPTDERLALLAGLDAALRFAFRHFLELRTRPIWKRTVVPALRAWLDEGT